MTTNIVNIDQAIKNLHFKLDLVTQGRVLSDCSDDEIIAYVEINKLIEQYKEQIKRVTKGDSNE